MCLKSRGRYERNDAIAPNGRSWIQGKRQKAKGKSEKKSRKAKPKATELEQLSLLGFE
jgi:hypothetical protein